MSETAKEGRRRVTVLFVGWFWKGDSRDIFQSVHEVDPNTNDGRSLPDGRDRWYKPIKRGKTVIPTYAQAGSIWSIEVVDKGDEWDTVYYGTARLVGEWQNSVEVASWQAASRARRQEWEAFGDAKKKATKRRDYEWLEPIRLAYQRANPNQRAFILANVINYIQRGSPVGGGSDD